MKNKTTLTFREQYNARQETKSINENSWFCIVAGGLLFSVGFYGYMCTTSILMVMSCIAAVVGILIAVCGGFFPKIIAKPTACLKKFLNFIGHTTIKILLLPVYLIMTVVNFFTKKKYEARFMYYNWENNDRIKPAFIAAESVERKKKKYAFLQIISDVFSSLSRKKAFLLFPLAVILIMLGLVLFFASSNAVFSFVYTLF